MFEVLVVEAAGEVVDVPAVRDGTPAEVLADLVVAAGCLEGSPVVVAVVAAGLAAAGFAAERFAVPCFAADCFSAAASFAAACFSAAACLAAACFSAAACLAAACFCAGVSFVVSGVVVVSAGVWAGVVWPLAG